MLSAKTAELSGERGSGRTPDILAFADDPLILLDFAKNATLLSS